MAASKKMSSLDDVVHDISRVLQRAVRGERWPCLICGTPTRNRGIFMPGNPQAWGAAKGNKSACVYAICGAHDLKSPDTSRRVELLLRADRGLQ
jgi:hypothetical protein